MITKTTNGPVQNSIKEIWPALPGDYYSDSIFVTKENGIGIKIGGNCTIMNAAHWHKAAEIYLQLKEMLK